MGTRVSLTPLSALGTLCLLLGFLIPPRVRAFASSYCVLFSFAWLLSVESLFFSKERWRRSGFGERGYRLGWEKWSGRGGEGLWSGCIVLEKDSFSIIIQEMASQCIHWCAA